VKKTVRLGIIGIGTVGDKVLAQINKNRAIVERKAGARLEFAYVCDKDRALLRKAPCGRGCVRTDDWKKVVNDPSVDIVVELIGGHNPAGQIIMQSLENNKHVVTANKAILAENWHAIFSLAKSRQRLVYFEASVAGSVPIIQALNEGLAANSISNIVGILNGTCNYILTKMTGDNVSFDEALKEAQRAGFAEPDPTLDITGADTAHKLAILSSIAWAEHVKPGNIYCEGISSLSNIDIRFARSEFGYIAKLLGVAKLTDGALELYVRPCFIPEAHTLGSVDNEFNAILVDGDACGRMIFQGKGAGGYPAASAVVSDIMFLARQVATGTAGRIPYVDYVPERRYSFLDINESRGSYYLRINALDKPGVLSQVSGILGRHKVSIASVYQKGPLGRAMKGVPILMLTHGSREGSVRAALDEIDKLKVIVNKSVMLKIEES
jgi:homoserine dehydrogenase